MLSDITIPGSPCFHGQCYTATHRDFARATKRIIREASHAEKGEGSFLAGLKRCCLGPCGSKALSESGTKEHVS